MLKMGKRETEGHKHQRNFYEKTDLKTTNLFEKNVEEINVRIDGTRRKVLKKGKMMMMD